MRLLGVTLYILKIDESHSKGPSGKSELVFSQIVWKRFSQSFLVGRMISEVPESVMATLLLG